MGADIGSSTHDLLLCLAFDRAQTSDLRSQWAALLATEGLEKGIVLL